MGKIVKNGIEYGGAPLPIASSQVVGGVKVGNGLSIAPDGTLSAQGGSYVLPPATAQTLGGIKVGSGLTVGADGTLSAQGGGGGGSDGLSVVTLTPFSSAGTFNNPVLQYQGYDTELESKNYLVKLNPYIRFYKQTDPNNTYVMQGLVQFNVEVEVDSEYGIVTDVMGGTGPGLVSMVGQHDGYPCLFFFQLYTEVEGTNINFSLSVQRYFVVFDPTNGVSIKTLDIGADADTFYWDTAYSSCEFIG